MHSLSNDSRFRVKNLGIIKSGEFIQKPLTIFCGPNNSGKTWAMYSLYHCHKLLGSLLRNKKKSKGKLNGVPDFSLKKFNRRTRETLTDLFNAPPELLKGVRFDLVLENEADWTRLTGDHALSSKPFLMPAERSGLHLFFRELSTRRTALLHHASKENIDLSELLRDVIRSRYSLPIAHYIDWLNNLADIQRESSGSFNDHARQLNKHLARGRYTVDRRTGSIEFKPYQQRRDGNPTHSMGLHMASSTVKSLFGLWFYLENQAQPGNLLMIDEPELNIHPKNQRAIARLLAQLVNAGLNVVISTHSDYIIRELNSLIMLDRDNDKSLRQTHQYKDDEILETGQVGAYLFDNQTITPFETTPEDGIWAKTFDEVITQLNKVNDDIYYSLREQSDE